MLNQAGRNVHSNEAVGYVVVKEQLEGSPTLDRFQQRSQIACSTVKV